ncbi:hypothetical protein HELRODRAFT_190831 [Helobdella robusta]|uniref:Uncharacterized protein n=1 Tax=Helobdella robusta TaxID=6412 RepID=T1FSC1_HELRO|nr:hypothetical protein HELRODRAFT_190831 [Helobdella robusta]ESO07980.1 hypothetical protein HELRODRAFT_190831 [Helobdella robusta]
MCQLSSTPSSSSTATTNEMKYNVDDSNSLYSTRNDNISGNSCSRRSFNSSSSSGCGGGAGGGGGCSSSNSSGNSFNNSGYSSNNVSTLRNNNNSGNQKGIKIMKTTPTSSSTSCNNIYTQMKKFSCQLNRPHTSYSEVHDDKLSKALASVNKDLFNTKKIKSEKDQEKDQNKQNLAEKLNESLEHKQKIIKLESTTTTTSTSNINTNPTTTKEPNNGKENKPSIKSLNRSASLFNPHLIPTSPPLKARRLTLPNDFEKRFKATPSILKKKQNLLFSRKSQGHLSMSSVNFRQFTPSKFFNNPLSSTPISKRVRNRKTSAPPVVHVGSNLACPPCKKQIFLGDGPKDDDDVQVRVGSSRGIVVYDGGGGGGGQIKEEDEENEDFGTLDGKTPQAPPPPSVTPPPPFAPPPIGAVPKSLTNDHLVVPNSLVFFETPSKALYEEDDVFTAGNSTIRMNLFTEMNGVRMNNNSTTKHSSNNIASASQQLVDIENIENDDFEVAEHIEAVEDVSVTVNDALPTAPTLTRNKQSSANMDCISKAFMKVVCCDTTHKQFLLKQAKDLLPQKPATTSTTTTSSSTVASIYRI